MTSIAYTSLLLAHQKISPVTVWEKIGSHLQVWAVICTMFPVEVNRPPFTFDVMTLIEEMAGVVPCLHAQYRCKTEFPVTLL